MDHKAYAGIGSQKTPESIQMTMSGVATALAGVGYTLRSGFADGADKAFEAGCDFVQGKKEIYIPWRGFNGSHSDPLLSHYIIPEAMLSQAMAMASRYHPVWDKLSYPVMKLMARNAFQILGPKLKTPVSFVICWTEGGRGKGGTGQGIRMAQAYGIPVIDLGATDGRDKLQDLGRRLISG